MNMQEIAICYIVKDEAEDLRASLDSLSDVPGERIICSTAGSDAVRHVAEAVGARILSFSWTGDFSAARNFLLERVQAKWLIFLDADESVASCPGGLPALLAGEKADLLLIPWRNIDRDTGEDLGTSLAPRIFRGDKGFRYFGSIHEQLRQGDASPIEDIRVLAPEELLLLHTGYSKALLREKGERNLALLIKEREKGDRSPLNARYLADAYDGLGDTESAIRYAWESVGGGRTGGVYASAAYDVLLRCLSRTGRRQERILAARQAVRDFPELPAYRAELSSSLANVGELREAVSVMEEALAMREENPLEPKAFGPEAREIAKGWLARWKSQLREKAKEKTPVTITACLIARNEERDLPHWLKTTAFADERIVLDTGSTDQTAELAREAGCQVYSYEWADDFAAARNAALCHAAGEWVVFLDADESFEDPREVRPYLESLAARPEAKEVRRILAWMKNIDEDKGGIEFQRFPAIRIFRRAGARYEGRLHETLVGAADTCGTLFVPGALAMLHTGYSAGRILAKAKRNLALLQAEIAEIGEQDRHFPYLAKSYLTLGDFQKAELYALKAIASPLSAVGSDSELYTIALTSMERLGESAEELLALLRAAEARFPALPDFHGREGLLLADMEAEGALSALLRAIELAEGDGLAQDEASDFASYRGAVYGEAARLLAERGEKERALELLNHLFATGEEDPWEERVLAARWALSREEGSAEEALCRFRSSYPDTEESALQLARFLERAGFLRAYRAQAGYVREHYGKELPYGERYGLSGEEALRLLRANDGEVRQTLSALSREEGIESRELLLQLSSLLLEKGEENS